MKNIIVCVSFLFFIKSYSQTYNNIFTNSLSKKDNSTIIIENKIDNAIILNDWKKQIVHLRSLSKIYNQQGATPMALKFILEAIQISEKNNSCKYRAGMYMKASSNLEKIGAYKEAIFYRKKQYEWYKENNGFKNQYYAVDAIARLYYQIKDYSKSRKYYYKALSISKQIKHQHTVAHSNNNIGLTFLKNNENDSAKVYFNKALKAFKNNPEATKLDSLMIGIVSGNLSKCYTNNNNLNLAISLLKENIRLAIKYNSYETLMQANLSLVQLYLKDDNYEKAKFYNDATQSIIDLHPHERLQLSIYKNYLRIYIKTKNIINANVFIEKFIQLNDSLYGPKIIDKITETKSIYQLHEINYELKLNEIILEKKAKEIIQLKQEEKIIKLNLYLITATTLLLLIVGYFVYLKMKNDHSKKLEIQIIKDQLTKAELKNKKIENNLLQGCLEVKSEELLNYAIEITESYKFTQKLRDELKHLKTNGKGDTQEYTKLLQKVNSQLGVENQLKEFQRKATMLHENFIEKLTEVNDKLTKNDFYLCSLIRLELSNKDIAILRNVSEKAIRMSKYRLKQKLLLPKEMDLGRFLKQL